MSVARLLRQFVKRLIHLRPARVHGGPGAGLLIRMHRASGAFDGGRNEMPVQEWIASKLRPGMTFYDVGANIGFFSLLAAKVVGEAGHVIAFEPVQENADAIRRNADLNGFETIIVVDVAVSKSTGEAELVLAEHPGGAALKSATTPPDATHCITVKTATLDSLVRRSDYPPPDVVKIDVEGAEMSVLEGMRGVVEDHRPLVVCEVDAATRDEAEAKAREVEEIMRGWGYATSRLAESYANAQWKVVHVVGDGKIEK
jgi:FkbM family methyltransferase